MGDDITEKMQEKNISDTEKDKRNMRFAISKIGCDPFEGLALTAEDRRYCFDILAPYLETEGIAEDGHKLRSIIEIAILYCQCRRLSEAMNAALAADELDEAKIGKLTSAKSSLLSSIASIAKDNNISSQYSKTPAQGRNSLAAKMKEMEANGFEDIKVNLFDIKTAEAFKQIDRISSENIAAQLALDSREYGDIIRQQRELIESLSDKAECLEEENRILKNSIADLTNRKASKRTGDANGYIFAEDAV